MKTNTLGQNKREKATYLKIATQVDTQVGARHLRSSSELTFCVDYLLVGQTHQTLAVCQTLS